MKSMVSVCLLVVAFIGSAAAQAGAPAPANCMTVYQTAQANGLTTLMQAIQLDSLTPYLNDRNLGYTVFAPTNAAFQNAFNMLDTNLTDILYSGHLDALLQYHFLLQPYTGAQLVQAAKLPTNNANETLSFSMSGSSVRVTSFADEALVTKANIQACDSIVHVIDHVLLPDFASEGLSATL